MLDPASVPPVEPDESLARFVFSRSHFSRVKGRIKAGAFMPAPNGEVSVTRTRDSTQNDLWGVGHGIAASRGLTLRCRGEVLAATCQSLRLHVADAPVPGNPNHANILGWPMGEKGAHKLIAEELAVAAKFVPLPEPQDG